MKPTKWIVAKTEGDKILYQLWQYAMCILGRYGHRIERRDNHLGRLAEALEVGNLFDFGYLGRLYQCVLGDDGEKRDYGFAPFKLDFEIQLLAG